MEQRSTSLAKALLRPVLWSKRCDSPRDYVPAAKSSWALLSMHATNETLTDYVAGFVTRNAASDIPSDVAHLGKRSVLDGIGLALAGAASECGRIAQRYLASLGIVSDRRQHHYRHVDTDAGPLCCVCERPCDPCR